MPVYVALLRAVNVGGTGMLPMAALKAICEDLGFADVKTYIQSGNVLFRSDLTDPEIQRKLETALAERMGKAPGVLLRSRRDLEAVSAKAPFPDARPNFLLVTFLPEPPPADALDKLVAPDGEEVKIEGAGGLYLLSEWIGAFEAQNAGAETRYGTQPQHRAQACGTGCGSGG